MDGIGRMAPHAGAGVVGAPRSTTLCPGAPMDTWGKPCLVGIYGAGDSFGQLPPDKASVTLKWCPSGGADGRPTGGH